MATGKFFGRYLFDKQMADVQGQYQNQESFQVAPMNDPDKILLLAATLRKPLGLPVSAELEGKLKEFFSQHQGIVNYYDGIVNSNVYWIKKSNKKTDIPHRTKYWAEHNKCYVWVCTLPEHEGLRHKLDHGLKQLANFSRTGPADPVSLKVRIQ